jgi:hypothetical protein
MPRYDPAVSHRVVFALNVHASYACGHSGACCTAGWSIPVEPRIRFVLGADWLVPDETTGACPQFDRASRLCRVHRDHGESMLPQSCHHFPRRALVDRRGTFVSLSHYCPTAASLLLDTDAPLSIVANPPAFTPERGYEGLDATRAWPPLLRPGVLSDHESFGVWEQFLVTTLGSTGQSLDGALSRIADVGEQIRRWTPREGPLLEWTEGAVSTRSVPVTGACGRYVRFTGGDAFTAAAASVPAGLARPLLPRGCAETDAELVASAWQQLSPLLLRYLGARAFASWTAYQSRGIRTQVAELFMTAAVLRVECVRACQKAHRTLARDTLHEAVRAADLLLVHLADREALMAWLGKVER